MNISTTIRRLKLWIVIIPLALILLGTMSNQAVLIANHDKFPVMWNGVYGSGIPVGGFRPHDAVHCMMGPATHLNWLADIFDLQDALYSIGDFFILAGEWLWQYAPAIWIFTLCSTILGGKNESFKYYPCVLSSHLFPGLGGPNSFSGAYAGTGFNGENVQSLQNKNTPLRVC